METQQSKDNFDKLYWFCVGIVSYGMIFLTCLVWVPIPKDNIRFADVILGFITGSLITGAIAYLLGGSAPTKKPTAGPVGINNVDLTLSASTESKAPEDEINNN